MKTAVLHWPGSEVEGMQPTYWFPYSDDWTLHERVDKIIDMVDNKGVQLVCAYISHLDNVGHQYGPDSPQVYCPFDRRCR